MIKEAISKLVEKQDLTRGEAVSVMTEIMSGEASEAQIASFITALRMKGETVDEITGCALVMREKAAKIKSTRQPVVDTCGTGGDKSGTFNISTCAAFVAAGAGCIVAKHGNRSVSSSCGSADVLRALGVKIDVDISVTERCLNELGIGFLFAPLYHSAMKYANGPRQQIGIRTVFNILGPLTNPAGATAQVLGVYSVDLTDTMASVLKELGSKHALVVHGADKLDEITITGDTKIVELKQGKLLDYYVEPKDFGFKSAPLSSIKGGTAEENAQLLIDVLKGKPGPRRDVVLMNAGAAILASDIANTLSEGVAKAAQSLDSGAAFDKLEQLKKITNSI
ncbi:MAG: anthranilate phosphoribosyltransferase [bacterium]|nr:anthranilate phosphoribosyltransferase [bacterium]